MQITTKYADVGVKVLLALMVAAVLIDIGSLAYLGSNHLLGKMWKVVWHNFQFPMVLALLAGYGVYWKLKHPGEFTMGELIVYMVVTPIAAFPLAAMMYFVGTDLHDIEIWNGRVTQSVYEEKWTEEVVTYDEECTGSGKDERCTTVRRTHLEYHPPSWYIHTSNNETIGISSDAYRRYTNRFGNETFKYLFRSGQVSVGDGNMYYADWKGQPDAMIPTAVEHPFVNYLRASQSITKTQGAVSSYAKLLLPYPRVHEGPFGNIEVDRVLSAGVTLPAAWKRTVNERLSAALATLGSKKQVNVLVYVTNADAGFFYALKEYWTDGKKNDVIVVIGSKDGIDINWVQVQAWTTVELFKIQLADSIRSLKVLEGGAEKLVDKIVEHIEKSPQTGGFQRMPMAALEYLLVEIDLPMWATFLMILLDVLIVTPFIIYLTTNNVRSRRTYA